MSCSALLTLTVYDQKGRQKMDSDDNLLPLFIALTSDAYKPCYTVIQ